MENINCCAYCRFWMKHECHKHPPNIASDGFSRVWPNTEPTDWCGSFDGNKEWEKVITERHAR